MPYTIFLWFLYCHKNVGRIEINNFIENFIGLLPGRIWSGYAKEVSLVIYWNIYHLSWLHLSIEMFVRLTCRLKSSLEKSCFYFFLFVFDAQAGFCVKQCNLFQRSPSWYISSLLRRQEQWQTLLLWPMWQLCNPMLSTTWEWAVTPAFSVLARSWVSWHLSSRDAAWEPLM